jgi:adenosylcobinamide kinase / adenosylcobinamide-phosphate guanylyltransferase
MSDRPTITLIIGGCRSGKSRRALEIASGHAARFFIATAEACDGEMGERIGRHRAERGDAFQTIEAPLDPAAALATITVPGAIAIIDCLTVWLGNLFHHGRLNGDSCQEIGGLLEILRHPPCSVVLVTNEVGLGIVPDSALGRAFRDRAGWLNQRTAAIADKVILMVAGLPVDLKSQGGNQ